MQRFEISNPLSPSHFFNSTEVWTLPELSSLSSRCFKSLGIHLIFHVLAGSDLKGTLFGSPSDAPALGLFFLIAALTSICAGARRRRVRGSCTRRHRRRWR